MSGTGTGTGTQPLPVAEDARGADGLWCEVLSPPAQDGGFSGRAALFLDRDGVIVDEVHYLHRPAEVRVVPGAAAVIAAANAHGVPVVVVTNQSGIGRGYYDWAAFRAVEAEIRRRLADAGAAVDLVLACPHVPPEGADTDIPGRKPHPGMLWRAGAALGLDLAGSWIVGDRPGDLGAGRRGGLAGGVLVASGHAVTAARAAEAEALAAPDFAVRRAGSLADLNDLPRALAAAVA